jgi:PAS domain S-box-containing protein
MGAADHKDGAQASLDESAEDLYDNAPCGYLSATPDGNILRVNATFLRWTGYRRDELVGVKRFDQLLTAGGRIYHETHYRPLLRMQGSVREIALDIVRADGSRLPVLINSVLKRDADGAPLLVRTTVFDARDRKRYERELLAARNRERVAREQVERLQRITAGIAAAPGAGEIAARVTHELVGWFGAQRAGVAVMDPQSESLRVIASVGDPQPGDLGGSPSQAAFDEGEDGHRGASLQLPLPGAPGMSGRLWLAFDEARTITPEERGFLWACAEQTALALERARLYEEQRDVAQTLQQNLLAGAPPADPRYDVASAYHPALEHLEVGGDWHDAFRLPGDKVAIVVGDVVGRGIAAASAMGQLRSAVRALAGAGFEPAAVIVHLDSFVAQIEAAQYATLAYAEVDPATGTVCTASAGHMPPLLLHPGRGPEFFMEGRSTPLGIPVGDGRRSQAAFRLAPGGGFLLYTDGLVERRGEMIDLGLERLASAVRARAGASPAELVEALPGALLENGASDDDVCLLGFRLLAPGR